MNCYNSKKIALALEVVAKSVTNNGEVKILHNHLRLDTPYTHTNYLYLELTKNLTFPSNKKYPAKISKNGNPQYYVNKKEGSNHFFSSCRDLSDTPAKKAYQNVRRLFEQARKLQITTIIPFLTITVTPIIPVVKDISSLSINKIYKTNSLNNIYGHLFKFAKDLDILVRYDTDGNLKEGNDEKLEAKVSSHGLSDQDKEKLIQEEWTRKALFYYIRILEWLAPFKDREDLIVRVVEW